VLAGALVLAVLGGFYWQRQGPGFCAWAFASAELAAARDLNCPWSDVSGGFSFGGCSLLSIRACGKRVTYACYPQRLPLLGWIYGFACQPAAGQVQHQD
jgi:hypothetical protein